MALNTLTFFMKKILLGVVGFFPAIIFGQIGLIPKYTHPDSSLLFIGMDNEFSMSGLNEIKAVSVFSSLNSKCSFFENKLIVRPNAIGIDTLKIYKNKKLLLIKAYTVEYLGNPTPQLAYSSDTLMSVSRIVAMPYFTIRIPKATNIGPFRISTFECSLIHNKMSQQKEVYSIDGSKLSEQLVSAIKKMTAGDEILFSDIIVIGPDSKARKVPNYKVTIK